MKIDESLLTGESLPVDKIALTQENQLSSESENNVILIYSGTMVVQGQGIFRVSATGFYGDSNIEQF